MAATARLEVRVRPESKAKIALAEIGVSSEFDEPPRGSRKRSPSSAVAVPTRHRRPGRRCLVGAASPRPWRSATVNFSLRLTTNASDPVTLKPRPSAKNVRDLRAEHSDAVSQSEPGQGFRTSSIRQIR